MLTVERLTKWYNGIPAVRDVSFEVAPGQVLGCLGANGSGKTTTVSMIMGLIEPDGGIVRFGGIPTAADMISFRRHVGYVPEQPHVYPFMTGREFLQLIGDLRELPAHITSSRVDRLLAAWEFSPSEYDTPLSMYSKGMRQKVLISAALLPNPDVLVFDEPTSGLDATSNLVFDALISELAVAGKAIFYCSHDIHSIQRTSDRVIVLREGKVVASGTVDQIKATMASPTLESAFAGLLADFDAGRAARALLESTR